MLKLPVITAAVTCEGCGACCATVGTPPFDTAAPAFVAAGLIDLDRVPRVLTEGEDWWHLAAAPPEAKEMIVGDQREVWAGREPRANLGLPCLWLDPETRECRYYEHRPEVCRAFRANSAACLAHRRQQGIDEDTAA